MINRSSMQAAFDLLEHLQARGIRCVIAGGCARDIFFGVKPKDIDIITVGVSFREVMDALDAATVAYDPMQFYDHTDHDRIIGCCKLSTVPIDVIVYDFECATQAIGNFDYNLNQFLISGTQHGIDGAHVRFVGDTHWGQLVEVRGIPASERNLQRRLKMQAKYVDLVPRRATGELPVTCPVGGPDGPF
ncbi:hypothetical protein [Pseudomonas sp. SID14000]|uniref:hypothetical protein n=1 Tax=Pseudomonas sp. SID14000 TaxID=1986221 RepID=UPI000B3C7F3B|nr:hypothetical protein [Pseudomonas sp. SID14000]